MSSGCQTGQLLPPGQSSADGHDRRHTLISRNKQSLERDKKRENEAKVWACAPLRDNQNVNQTDKDVETLAKSHTRL